MVIASLCMMLVTTTPSALADDEVTAWLEAAADESHYLLDDGVALRAGPSAEHAGPSTLRIGTRVRVVGERDGWTQVVVLEGSEQPLEGWVPDRHLSEHPLDADALHERWQEANAAGALAQTVAALERAVAFDGGDVAAWERLAELLEGHDPERAAAIRADLEGRRRVYVADPDGRVMFSFLPAVSGTIVATLVDESPYLKTSARRTQLAAEAARLDGTPWFTVTDARPAAVGGPSLSPTVRPKRFRRGMRIVQLGASPGAWLTTTPSVLEHDGWWHMRLQGFRLRVGEASGQRCTDYDHIYGLDSAAPGEFCQPWRGVRVEVQRGAEIEVRELITDMDGC